MRASAPEETLETTLDILGTAGAAVVGAVAGLVLALVIGVVLGLIGRRRPLVRVFATRIRGALRALLMVVGAAVAFYLSTRLPADVQAPGWRGGVQHGLLVAVILAVTWTIASAAQFLEDAALRSVRERAVDGELTTHARRVQTQAVMLRRVGVVVIWIVGLAVVLLTFPGARAAGASMLASAGILSVVAGLAAQNSLTNVFAGIQLAFTDAIRVDDIVIVEDEFGYIEEITLTYVVVRVWDDRRIILPSTYFTTTPFENWTRRVPQMLGTFLLDVDWRVPVPAMRAELERLLATTDLWDGRTGILQVFDAKGGLVTLRVLVSAKDPGTLTDLRYYLREHLVDYLQVHAPYALPRTRLEDIPPPPGARVAPEEIDPEVAEELARDLTELAALDAASRPERADDVPVEEEPEERRRREATARRARRRAERDDRRRARVEGGSLGRLDQLVRPEDTGSQTQVLSGEALAAALGASMSAGPDGPDGPTTTPAGAEPRTGDVAPPGADRPGQEPDVRADVRPDVPRAAEKAAEAAGERDYLPPGTHPGDYVGGPLRTSLLHRFDLAAEAGVDEEGPETGTTTTAGHEASLFTGSPENEARAAAFQGPGQEAIAEREARAEERRSRTGEHPVVATSVLPAVGAVPEGDASGGEPGQDADAEPGLDADARSRQPAEAGSALAVDGGSGENTDAGGADEKHRA